MLLHEKTCVIPIVVYRFLCMALYHSLMRRHVIKDSISDLTSLIFVVTCDRNPRQTQSVGRELKPWA